MEYPDNGNDRIDPCVYFCFILNKFGELTEGDIGEMILSAAPADHYFEVMGNIGFMLDKGLIGSKHDDNRHDTVYFLLPEGNRIAKDLSSRLAPWLKNATLESGKEVLSRKDREKTIKCDILYDRDKDRYDLAVRFLNELNGDTILEMKLYAPDKKRAEEMQERFLSKPSFTITRIMNMFIKDDLLMHE